MGGLRKEQAREMREGERERLRLWSKLLGAALLCKIGKGKAGFEEKRKLPNPLFWPTMLNRCMETFHCTVRERW